MKIGITNDHAAVDLKKELVAYLESQGHEVVNFGTDTNASVDYALQCEMCANAVANGEVERGIAICGTGNGIGISCNKVAGIRCAICSEPYTARYSRLHNDCNMIAFGARVIGSEMAKMIVDEFLNTEFEGGRHQRRVDQIMDIEARNHAK